MPSVVSGPTSSSGSKISPGPSSTCSAFSSTPDTYDYTFKIITLGISGVGKTCLSIKYTTGDFREKNTATCAPEFSGKIINVKNKNLRLALWDTAGQDNFRAITAQYVRNSDGVILAYDTTDRASFKKLHYYIDLANKGAENAIQILVGCKADLTERRQISHRKGQALAEILDMSFFETSAKDASNVDAVFRTLCTQILESRTGGLVQDENHFACRSIKLAEPTGNNTKRKSSSCC